MNFYSQHGEDKWIRKNLPLPNQGTFCEVGVGHSTTHSNTKHFEESGWTGVLIEPDTRSHAEITKNRKAKLFKCAAGQTNGTTSFVQTKEPTWSGTLRTDGHHTTVPQRTLSSILEEAHIGKLDLLSIDTEGSELDVIAGLDFDKHQPTIVIIEWYTIGLPVKLDDLIHAMYARQYSLVWLTQGNLIFHRQNR